MNLNCYLRRPDFSDEYFVFITDDDLWKVETGLLDIRDSSAMTIGNAVDLKLWKSFLCQISPTGKT